MNLPNKQVIWNLILMKVSHQDWCELKTGLWDECDCGATDLQKKLYGRYLDKLERLSQAKSE